jgi:hypothetical protein
MSLLVQPTLARLPSARNATNGQYLAARRLVQPNIVQGAGIIIAAGVLAG